MLILLSTAAITVELILRTFLDLGNRIKYLIFVGLFFLLVWLQLAVGIF
jgi:ammonia channel protein AmtB